jgi:hypothetical protein
MTDVPLKEHLEVRIREIEKREAIVRADLERRLEGMNEFREQLRLQANTFMTKNSFELEHRLLTRDVKELTDWKNVHIGKESKAYMISIVAIVISTLFAILHYLK